MTSREPIHSGHFMTSNPHNDVPDEDEDVEVEVVDDEEDRIPEGDAETSRSLKQDEKPVTFYKFGPKKTQSIAIDVSLNKINKCIKVAYNKMTTPKWKDFKGLRLHWKQRIRLNNVIWRAYYMEFRRPIKNKCFDLRQRKTPYCYFAVPDDDTTHIFISGTVMEGMYWKRRMEAVCAQYKRWRHFAKTRCKRGRKRENSSCCDVTMYRKMQTKSQTPKNTSSDGCFDPDDLNSDFTDALFESLLQPYMFPNPKEMAGCNADVMQPGLLSLQPSIEEIMSSLNDPPQSGDPEQQVPPPSVSSSYSAKEYDTAHMLVDYGNQTQPTRQPSSISSQMLMANSFTPTYSQAACVPERAPSMPYTDNSNLDYVPQFLSSSGLQSSSSTMLSTRPWWMLPQAHTFLGSPSAPSPLMQSPPGLSPISVNCHSSVPPLILNSPSNETLRSNTPSKGALKAYPSPNPPQKVSNRWMLPTTSVNSNPMLPSTSSVSMESSVQLPEESPWKIRSPISPNVPPSIPIPQPVYPSLSTQMSTSSSHALESPPSVPPSVSSAVPPHPSTVLIKEEEDEKERPHRPMKRFRSAAADSTIEPVERKRILHLNAEQNRRSALKDGFEQLLNLLPNVYAGGTKPTNAVVLARGAERIRELNNTLTANNKKADEYKQYIQRLNDKIASLQASLPSSSRGGATMVSQKALVEQFLERCIKERSRQDFRFWLMAKMMRPLIESFSGQICEEMQGRDTLARAANDWLRGQFQPAALRPLAPAVLIYLASNTSFLNDPSSLQKHVQKEISKQ